MQSVKKMAVTVLIDDWTVTSHMALLSWGSKDIWVKTKPISLTVNILPAKAQATLVVKERVCALDSVRIRCSEAANKSSALKLAQMSLFSGMIV